MFTASNIHYELADRVHGLGPGGIGAMHLLARRTGLIEAMDKRLGVLKIHQPYHESDHVLNIAYNLLCGGACLEDIELRRNDEVYLDALGAKRIPDPTTAGDFCRRFETSHIQELMNAINDVRVKVWRDQPEAFFDEAILDADGTLSPTTGECKEGMDISYKGVCQIVRTSRRIVYRLLAWNSWQDVFLRGVDALHGSRYGPMRC
jgi:hypothetical protein